VERATERNERIRREAAPVRIRRLTSFGQDGAGELYAVALGGSVYKIVRGGS
jgi:hypothetical protein